MTDNEMIEQLRFMASVKVLAAAAISQVDVPPGIAMLLERKPEMRERIEEIEAESINERQIDAGALSLVADNLESGKVVPNVLIKYVVKMAKEEDRAVENITAGIEDIYEDNYESEEEYEDAKIEEEHYAESARTDAAFLRTVIRRARQTQ